MGDMGLTKSDLVQLIKDYEANMDALRKAILNAGKFEWHMMWFGAPGVGLGPIVQKGTCAADLRSLCTANSPPQTRAMGYGLNHWQDPAVLPDLKQDLSNFLLIRGPYAWLGHGWRGCSRTYLFPPEFNVDYGVPSGLCKETAPNSGIFTRDYSKATVKMDCNAWEGSITMKSDFV